LEDCSFSSSKDHQATKRIKKQNKIKQDSNQNLVHLRLNAQSDETRLEHRHFLHLFFQPQLNLNSLLAYNHRIANYLELKCKSNHKDSTEKNRFLQPQTDGEQLGSQHPDFHILDLNHFMYCITRHNRWFNFNTREVWDFFQAREKNAKNSRERNEKIERLQRSQAKKKGKLRGEINLSRSQLNKRRKYSQAGFGVLVFISVYVVPSLS
jgi:hypothetical protein